MDKISIVNQFNDFYINENQISHIEDLSRDMPVSEIDGLNPNQIIIGSTMIDIPDSILESADKKNIDIDAYLNPDEKIYYVNNSFKKYYKIHQDISLENYKLNQNEILNFNFEYNEFESLGLKFIIIEFSESKGLISRQYNQLNNVKILPHTDTKFIRIFLKPENAGFIYNIDFDISVKKMNVINNYDLEVNSGIIYNPEQRVVIRDENEMLEIEVPELDKNFIYFSYKIQNNSFNKIPESSLIKVNPENLYEVYIPFILHDEVDFTPTIIEYNGNGKTNLIKLSSGKEFIKFQKDTTVIRLSYRFSGSGKVKTGNVLIKEYEGENDFESVKWSSRYEIDTHMKTLQNIKDLRVAVIMDEFTYHSYKYEADLLRLSFDNWKNEMTSFMPHFIFIESSWHGNDSEWTKKIAYVTDEKHSYIKNLISYAKYLDIPVVFWNKEDPVHYDHFIETAKLCDYVFTTDRDKVENYKLDCNHENVDVLQFAAQPRTHNPIKIQKERVEGISFAGSYYALREERSMDMNRLFKAAIPYNLYIYDRNYEYTKKGERLNFLFPEEFRKYILGSLPFYQIDKAYKSYKFMININTVKYSPTMYARRVYEGLASGTPIISNYSLGMENQFGDIIGYSEDEGELKNHLAKLNEDDSEYNKVKQIGIRRVLSQHTYSKRLLQIATNLGFDLSETIPEVTFVSFIENTSMIDKVEKIFNRLKYTNKKLLIIVKDDVAGYSTLKNNITVISRLNIIKYFMTLDQIISSEYIAILDRNDFYGENYLEDLILATLYTEAEIIGKSNYYSNENGTLKQTNQTGEHEYTGIININASVMESEVFSNLSLEETLDYLMGKKLISDLRYLGLRMYSNDKMNYVKNGDLLEDKLKDKVIV
ncbi:glycosyltransferase [Salinicoccus sp. HZC-1]|uniref:CgeB family protein n=1 Tax=Salinicoccus sp. HZC-1 TaxID=3385497 RepID=UPI00398B24A8